MTLRNQERAAGVPERNTRCGVRGLVSPGTMCGQVVMGGLCGHDGPCKHQVLPVRVQSQAEANAYWADKNYKKWVVEFTAGSRRNRRTAQAHVGAASAAGARRAGIACMEEQGKAWVRSAAATVRLATAQDLGCVCTGQEGGAQ
jgi:hypothetical protein